MTRAFHHPEHWRRCAEKLRTIAHHMQDDPESKLATLKLAADYDQLRKGGGTHEGEGRRTIRSAGRAVSDHGDLETRRARVQESKDR
jgi:hypothetical protein